MLKWFFICLEKKEIKKKVHEEVIAEDYDSAKEEITQIDITQRFMVCHAILSFTLILNNTEIVQKVYSVSLIFIYLQGYPGCPNKYNIYHDCTKKCKELWGKGHTQPADRYLKRQMKLIKSYPLPETWKAVYDPGR